jgi:mannose-6-phosphate isomerase-like protein (cupin superfamily)
MSNQLTVYPNTVTALLSHRVMDKTISVELGWMNIIVGERLITLKSGSNISIPKGTVYAYANLSPTQAIITERAENTTFANDVVVHADVDGVIYDTNPAPAIQSSHSLYLCLVDMLLKTPEKMSA